jgi:S1-C subfamily serine protease
MISRAAPSLVLLTALLFLLVFPLHLSYAKPPPLPLLESEKRAVEVYKRTNEAVVFISTKSFSSDAFLSYRAKADRTVGSDGAGSGVIVDGAERIILTSLHVISDAKSIQIMLADGKSYPARLLGHDPESDIAVLQLTTGPKNLAEIPFGDSRKLEVGQWVLAIGNPHGLARTLTGGIISSLHRTVRNPKHVLMKDLIQTDVALNPGSSGGPLLNSRGELIGINAAILSHTGESAGISFAVPIHRIRSILPELVATGKVLRPTLGWVLVDTNQGPLVRRVFEGGPAAARGVQPLERPVGEVFRGGIARDFDRADLITEVNGEEVRTVDDVERYVLQARRAEPITVTLRQGGRSGKERKITMKPVLE